MDKARSDVISIYLYRKCHHYIYIYIYVLTAWRSSCVSFSMFVRLRRTTIIWYVLWEEKYGGERNRFHIFLCLGAHTTRQRTDYSDIDSRPLHDCPSEFPTLLAIVREASRSSERQSLSERFTTSVYHTGQRLVPYDSRTSTIDFIANHSFATSASVFLFLWTQYVHMLR